MEEPGPFERVLQPDSDQPRDRAAVVIVAVAIILGLLMLVLVLPPISILKSGNGGAGVNDPVTAKIRDVLPPVPSGFEAVSALYDLQSQKPVDRAARLTITLSGQVPAKQELFLYTYQNSSWRQVGKAAPVSDGNAARGEVSSLPGNVAVFRKAATTRSIFGSLPAGGELDEAALATLTTLNPDGYTPSADGSIAGEIPALPNSLTVALAPIISAGDAASAGALHEILSSNDTRTAHVDAIVSLVNDKDYAGIDLDYSNIDPQQGAAFVTFVSALSTQLRQANRTLTLTLPAPAHQSGGWDTHGYDWDKLAPLVDAIEVVPDGDPGSYYATLNDALGYLVPRAGSSKLILRVDSLSRELGSDGLRTLTRTEALTLASTPAVQGNTLIDAGASVQAFGKNLSDQSGASALKWDAAAKAVTFTYTGAGGQRTVWLANTFSESFLLDLARRYQLRGVAIEDVSKRAADAGVTAIVAQYAKSGDVALVEPNGKLLAPSWTASGGTLDKDSGTTVTWHAPKAAGDYTLTLIVSDGVVRLGQELQLSVQASGRGSTQP